MGYPNVEFWSALRSDVLVPVEDDGTYLLSTVVCGDLVLPSGELVICDPFAGLRSSDNLSIKVPKGSYRVVVTLAYVSEAKDGSHMREAYMTLMIDEAAIEIRREIITPIAGQEPVPPEMGDDGIYYGFPVDAGTACFVDNQAVTRCMPDENNWNDEVFDNASPQCWFSRMDDPNHIRDGIANIELPLASNGENIVVVHSGWGDGHYPIVGGYDSADNLVQVHVDFMVVFNEAVP